MIESQHPRATRSLAIVHAVKCAWRAGAIQYRQFECASRPCKGRQAAHRCHEHVRGFAVLRGAAAAAHSKPRTHGDGTVRGGQADDEEEGRQGAGAATRGCHGACGAAAASHRRPLLHDGVGSSHARSPGLGVPQR